MENLEGREWIYQDYINTLAQNEASFRLKWEESKEENDQIRKKLIEAEKRAEQAISEKEVFAEKNEELEKNKSDLQWNLTQHSVNPEALSAAECKNDQLKRERAANEKKIRAFQFAMEENRHEKEGLSKELASTQLQSQIRGKELKELQRQNKDISTENDRLTKELAANQKKIEESQAAMEATHSEKEGLLKQLKATKSQLQVKEKEFQELQRKNEATHREKEGLFKDLEATKSQLQIEEKEFPELQRKNEGLSGEKIRKIAANETKIKESQETMVVTHCEKDDIFKELEATKSQLRSKEKGLEVALYEKDMVQSDTMQLEENELERIVRQSRNRRKKEKKKKKKEEMKRATDAHANPRIASATSSSIKWVLGAVALLAVFIVGIFLLRTRYYAS